jgi:hypothetical protein
MGTRSLTFVYENGAPKPLPVLCMYRQFDGYPEGHGRELSQFLGGFVAIVNGLRFNETRKVANGMGCLAAQLVGHFKSEAGGFYLYPTNSKDCGQDYEYHIYEDKIKVKVSNGKAIFTGSWKEFTDFCHTADVA